ncbi:hypothetical protein GQ55_2G323200 [Panicum hallii var. hallii]|uniref:Uncharacterized protein n=1 Tax=Panicum hallii var. hallii TaxID=1504633 RepID=A0A2T7EUR6_9POAL|nr:hypothetical protein GQ55_2G323200 [Panicum hallii var. hallii]
MKKNLLHDIHHGNINLDLKSTIASFCNTTGGSPTASSGSAPPATAAMALEEAGRIRCRRGGRPGRGAPAGADLLCAPPPRCSVAASPAMRSPRSRSGPAPRSSPQPRPLPSCPPPAAATVLVHRGARVGRAAGQRGEAPEGGQPARELRLITESAIIPAQFSQLNRISVI